MISTLQSQLLEKIRSMVMVEAPGSIQHEPDTQVLLKDPLLTHYIFPNNTVAIVDHSIFGYRYVSELSREMFGFAPEVFMKKGLALTSALMNSEDLLVIGQAIEKVASLTKSLPKEHQMHTRFNYSLRYELPLGAKTLFQQTIPMALNDTGVPYLVMAIVSDITPFTKVNHPVYNLTLNLPGELPETLLSNHSGIQPSPLTDREREIVLCLAEGLDAHDIAEKLFISEDTVRTHRKNILGKTQARNSVHLVRMAVANGWI